VTDEPGIVAAQADKEKRTFNVTFDRHETNAEEILKVASTVSKEAKLVSGRSGGPRSRRCARLRQASEAAELPGDEEGVGTPGGGCGPACGRRDLGRPQKERACPRTIGSSEVRAR